MLPIIHLIRAGNETWVCFGSGFCGMLSVLMTRNLCHIAQYAAYMGAGAGTMLALLNRYRPRRRVDRSHVVVVTGCDSGLGYNMALRCQQLNMFVVAACLDLRSEGARQLSAALDPKCSLVLALDLCDSDSIGAAHEKVRALLANDRRLQLSALVNNAGQMCFGEFEWQTGDQIVQQVTVNLLGTMAMTHAFLPLCRAHKSRIITVTSHCSVEALPGLAPYAASKAGLRFFVDALRVEATKYGVDVINFIPGSFVMSSNIAARQSEHADQQRSSMNAEQTHFYGDYFERYHGYLKQLGGQRTVRAFGEAGDTRMLDLFETSLLESGPRAVYRYEPTWRYRVYFWLFAWSPTIVRDYLVERFMLMPGFGPPSAKAVVK